MTRPRLRLERKQVLAYRRRVGGLDRRLHPGGESLRRAAWAGLQDSVPRAALLSIHARVEGTRPGTWEDPALVQLWGPRFSAFVVHAEDRAIFSLGRSPDAPARRAFGERLADRLEAFLDGRRLPYAEAGRGLGVSPNTLRYAAPTGRVLMRWDGARAPEVWCVPAPDVSPHDARLELARRYLHIFGPATDVGFGAWAGIGPQPARAAFEALAASLIPVRTPIGEAWILASAEAAISSITDEAVVGARLLPSGDAHFLLWGSDRELLVPDGHRRAKLWTSRVWPGAVVVAGELVGTWRRANAVLSVETWRRLSPSERHDVEAEAHALPIPGIDGPIHVRWGP